MRGSTTSTETIARRSTSGLEAVEALLRYFSTAAEGIGEQELHEAVGQAFAQEGEQIMATLAEKWTKAGIEEAAATAKSLEEFIATMEATGAGHTTDVC